MTSAISPQMGQTLTEIAQGAGVSFERIERFFTGRDPLRGKLLSQACQAAGGGKELEATKRAYVSEMTTARREGREAATVGAGAESHDLDGGMG